MLHIGDMQLQEETIYERSYNMRGASRRAIEIHFDANSGVTYDELAEALVDGAQIKRTETATVTDVVITNPIPEGEEAPDGYEPEYAEVPREETVEYDLTAFCVAGDIVDKRDGSFIAYMGQKTEAEIKDEEMAELILAMGGIE